MTDNEQNGQNAPDSIRIAVKFPFAQYGQVEVNGWMKQADDLPAQIGAFMRVVIDEVTPLAAELGAAWASAGLEAIGQAAGVPLPAGPAPVAQGGRRMAEDKGELKYPPKAPENVPGDTYQFIAHAYKLMADKLELWQDGAKYASQHVTPQSPAWPSEEWQEHMVADGTLQKFGKPVRVYCVVSDKAKSTGAYYVNAVRLEVA